MKPRWSTRERVGLVILAGIILAISWATGVFDPERHTTTVYVVVTATESPTTPTVTRQPTLTSTPIPPTATATPTPGRATVVAAAVEFKITVDAVAWATQDAARQATYEAAEAQASSTPYPTGTPGYEMDARLLSTPQIVKEQDGVLYAKYFVSNITIDRYERGEVLKTICLLSDVVFGQFTYDREVCNYLGRTTPDSVSFPVVADEDKPGLIHFIWFGVDGIIKSDRMLKVTVPSRAKALELLTNQ